MAAQPSSATAACAAERCGFLVIDKPAGLTSHGCVAAVRRAYGLRRVGHGGTLDPAVTGVLPMAVGPATRLLPYLQGEKVYRARVQLGVTTSSDDLEGHVLDRRPPPCLDTAQLEQALAPFRGEILQRPPAISAVHVGGERAYARARRGELVALPPRPVTIHSLCLLSWDQAGACLDLEVRCSAGTYIRALARDLGEQLGCGGALARLRRIETLGFDLSAAVDLDRLASAPPPPLLDPLLALRHLAQRQLLADELTSWRCGRSLPLRAERVEQAPSALAAASRGPAAVSPGPGAHSPEDLGDPARSPGASAEQSSPAPGQATISTDTNHQGHAAGQESGSPAAHASSVTSSADGPGEESRSGAAAPEGPAFAMLHPDGSLAGIARLDPAGLLRPRLVFDAAG